MVWEIKRIASRMMYTESVRLPELLVDCFWHHAGVSRCQICLLEPHRFGLVVEVTKHMSFNKVTPALNLGKTIGNLLTNACRSKYCLALREGDRKAKEDALAFQKLIETRERVK